MMESAHRKRVQPTHERTAGNVTAYAWGARLHTDWSGPAVSFRYALSIDGQVKGRAGSGSVRVCGAELPDDAVDRFLQDVAERMSA